MNPPSRTRSVAAFCLAGALFAGACGSDSEEPSADSTTTTTTTTTTVALDQAADASDVSENDADEPADSTPTTVAPTLLKGELVAGSVTNAAGVTASWTLKGDSGQLCFNALLSHPDAAVAETLAPDISDCLSPEGGLDDIENSLSVSVGSIDGDRQFGFVWGRAGVDIISLTIEHDDGSQTNVGLHEGPTTALVFALVIDTTTGPAAESLDAVSGTQLERSVSIRDFLQAGPTYPVVAPTTTISGDDFYPTTE